MSPQKARRVCRMDKRRFERLSDVADLLRQADLLQYRAGGGIIGKTISVLGRSPYSHSAMVCILEGEPYRVEIREFHGGRKDLLRHDVERYSGMIDVYRPCRVFYRPRRRDQDRRYWLDLEGAQRTMLEISKPNRYGYWGVLAAGLNHMPFIRWFMGYSIDDLLEKSWPPFCSQGYAYAIRKNFIDPVPMRPDYKTEPGDLTRSPLLSNYLFTLVNG